MVMVIHNLLPPMWSIYCIQNTLSSRAFNLAAKCAREHGYLVYKIPYRRALGRVRRASKVILHTNGYLVCTSLFQDQDCNLTAYSYTGGSESRFLVKRRQTLPFVAICSQSWSIVVKRRQNQLTWWRSRYRPMKSLQFTSQAPRTNVTSQFVLLQTKWAHLLFSHWIIHFHRISLQLCWS